MDNKVVGTCFKWVVDMYKRAFICGGALDLTTNPKFFRVIQCCVVVSWKGQVEGVTFGLVMNLLR